MTNKNTKINLAFQVEISLKNYDLVVDYIEDCNRKKGGELIDFEELEKDYNFLGHNKKGNERIKRFCHITLKAVWWHWFYKKSNDI